NTPLCECSRALEPRLVETSAKMGFWLDTFDFPMANFTRVSRSERFALVLQDYEPPKKEKIDGDKVPKVKLIYFPSARVGAKDKPFIDDVVSDLIHERKQSAWTNLLVQIR